MNINRGQREGGAVSEVGKMRSAGQGCVCVLVFSFTLLLVSAQSGMYILCGSCAGIIYIIASYC